MQSHIKKLRGVLIAVVAVIAAIELALTLRAVLVFDLTRVKLRLYLYSYMFLAVTSLAALAVTALYKRSQSFRLMLVTIYAYASCLVIWSAFVSCVDSCAGGDSGVIVYVMTCLSVGVLTLIKPAFFIPLLAATSGALLTATYFLREQSPYSGGFYINFLIFTVLAAFINIHTYRLNLREHESEQKLKSLSYTDQLTGVYNRRRLDKHLSSNLEHCENFLFVLMDIDDFKLINDIHGHSTGDRCLQILAEELKKCFGEHVYRYGGDEFAVISSLSLKEICDSIDALNRAVGIAFEGSEMHISAGIYEAQAGDRANDIFKCADRALYTSKRNGKMTWSIYSPEKNED